MKLLIIPDVHGRDFWIEPFEHIDEFDKVIFLGDYHDPYPFQVSKDTSRHRLRDILVPKILENKDKVICLVGNHDLSYLIGPCADRFDDVHRDEINKLLSKLPLQLTYQVDNYLFSHSGILPLWIEENNLKLEELNNLCLGHPALMQISPYRGGCDKVGSCVWGDVREYLLSYQYKDFYQIFGHTQLSHEIIKDTFACLDCRKAFTLDTKTKELKPYDSGTIGQTE